MKQSEFRMQEKGLQVFGIKEVWSCEVDAEVCQRIAFVEFNPRLPRSV